MIDRRNLPKQSVKNTLLAFFNLARLRAKPVVAHKTTTHVAVLPLHPCWWYSPSSKSTGCKRPPVAAVLIVGGMMMLFMFRSLQAEEAPPIVLKSGDAWPLPHETHHVQGLCVDEDSYWITSVQREGKRGWIFRIDRKTGEIATQREIQRDAQYHPGGMQLVDGTLWVPVAEYRPRSTSTMLQLDPRTLKTKGSFAIEDHIGGAAADGKGRVFAANWDCRTIYVFDTQGNEKQKLTNPTGVAYQDFEWHDGHLWGTGQWKQPDKMPQAVVDVLDPFEGKLVQRYTLEGTLRSGGGNFAREGFCKLGAALFLLPEDGPRTTVYRFPLK
jgi:hypothetical protein